jgi:hypothetical protein
MSPTPAASSPNSSNGENNHKMHSAPKMDTGKLKADVQALLQDSTSSLEKAVTQLSQRTTTVPSSNTEQQLLISVLEMNRKLEFEKLQMRTEIEKLRNANKVMEKELFEVNGKTEAEQKF